MEVCNVVSDLFVEDDGYEMRFTPSGHFIHLHRVTSSGDRPTAGIYAQAPSVPAVNLFGEEYDQYQEDYDDDPNFEVSEEQIERDMAWCDDDDALVEDEESDVAYGKGVSHLTAEHYHDYTPPSLDLPRQVEYNLIDNHHDLVIRLELLLHKFRESWPNNFEEYLEDSWSFKRELESIPKQKATETVELAAAIVRYRKGKQADGKMSPEQIEQIPEIERYFEVMAEANGLIRAAHHAYKKIYHTFKDIGHGEPDAKEKANICIATNAPVVEKSLVGALEAMRRWCDDEEPSSSSTD